MAHKILDSQRFAIREYMSIPGNTFASASVKFRLCVETLRKAAGNMVFPPCPCKRGFGHSGLCSYRSQFGPKRAVEVVVDGRCSTKGCPFPSYKENHCRTHFWDSKAQASILQPVSNLMADWIVN